MNPSREERLFALALKKSAAAPVVVKRLGVSTLRSIVTEDGR